MSNPIPISLTFSLPVRVHGCVICALLLLAGLLLSPQLAARELALAGIIGERALLVIDGVPARALAVGARSPEGVEVLGVSRGVVRVRYNGLERDLILGQQPLRLVSEQQSTRLTADARGHHVAAGEINGQPVRFLVDTGATLVSLGLTDAKRAGISYEQGEETVSVTANGTVRTWLVHLDDVRVGALHLRQVEAAVHDSELPVVLLGMSFLGRVQMQYEGQSLILRTP